MTALALAVAHTAAGPDHSLPFVFLARARRWSRAKTLWVTLLCGLGHVASSLALGGVCLVLGSSVARVERLEAFRGSLGAWALVALGAAYGVWGVRRALRREAGIALHEHDGRAHIHAHGLRPHRHEVEPGSTATFWMLFAVFVLGPCEPLIPLFVLPASMGRWGLAAVVALVFSLATVATMVAVVWLASAGLGRLPAAWSSRWSHAMAGGILAACGLVVLALGV